jgi:hypothetical protein
MNLTTIVEEPIDPKEVAKVLIAHAMQKLGPKPTEEEICNNLTNFAFGRISKLKLLPIGTVVRERDVGICLYRFAEEKIKHNRLMTSLNEAFAEVEAHDLSVTTIYIPAKDWVAFRLNIKDCFDESQAKGHKNFMGTLWGVKVFVDNRVKETIVNAACLPACWQ